MGAFAIARGLIDRIFNATCDTTHQSIHVHHTDHDTSHDTRYDILREQPARLRVMPRRQRLAFSSSRRALSRTSEMVWRGGPLM